MSKRKKKALILVASILMISLAIGESLAYFTQEETAHNIISTGGIKLELIENSLVDGKEKAFHNMSGVMPGDVLSKIVKLKNAGESDAYVRISVEKAVELAAGMNGEPDISLIGLDLNTADWTEKDGYYYYNQILRPGETTVPLFTCVTLDPAMDNIYQACTVTVSVTAQAVQAANNGSSALTAVGWPA